MVYTFDVFDTLITRATATPAGVFQIVQRRLELLPDFVGEGSFFASHFSDIRIEAERMARLHGRREGKEDITLDDIYRMIDFTNHVDGALLDTAKRTELRTEMDVSLPVRENVERLRAYMERGCPVYLISDMYLPAEVIRTLLLKHDDIFKSIPILVSCERNKTKTNGLLYAGFLKEYGIKPNEWLHIGDNPAADIVPVRRLGGRAELCMRSAFLNALYAEASSEAEQRVKGAEKYLYDEADTEATHVGKAYGGPILYAYTNWVLQDAVSRGIKRLYFIARDGYIIKRIADIIIRNRQLDMETQYLCGSRLTWKLPLQCVDTESLGAWLRQDCLFHSLKELAYHFSMEREVFCDYVSPLWTKEQWESKLSPGERRRAVNYLSLNRTFLRDAVARMDAAARKQRAQSYLAQELRGWDAASAFVEVKGSGATQRCLGSLMPNKTGKPILTYFFTVTHTEDIGTEEIVLKKYLQRVPEGVDMNLIEPFTRAPHGQTVDYEMNRDTKKWEPVTSKATNDIPEEKTFTEYLRGVEAVADMLSKHDDAQTDYYEICTGLISELADSPPESVSRFIGDMPMIAGWMSGEEACFAPELSDEETVKLALDGSLFQLGEWYTAANIGFSENRLSACKKTVLRRLKERYGQLPPVQEDLTKEIKAGARVIVYGAGKYGRRCVEQVRERSDLELVSWVDRNYKNLQDSGLDVSAPETIVHCQYDAIIVAVANAEASFDIWKYLSSVGVDISKIR